MTAHDASTRLNTALAGRYHIERELGEGGMATVYLAHDQRHERSVALKVMKSDVAELIGADRFLQEIRVTANLHHPHVLPLFDSGEADGALFYVMPYVEGESLRARLDREGALPVGDAGRIFREIVDALGAAHQQGLVHRDIKPANVLLTAEHAQVADFGVARALTKASEGEQLTTLGVAIGTPGYMAPEQAAADPRTDHRADLFAVGVLAYEMLTGRHPFVGESARATLAALMTETPPAITDLRPEVPPALAEAVHRCLEKDPDARWPNAAELLVALDEARIPGQESSAEGPPARGGGRLVPAVAAVALAGAAVLYFTLSGEDLEAWARSVAIPQIEDLAEVGEFEDAYRLAARAEEAIPNDPVLAELRAAVTAPLTLETEPPGAVVRRREYAESEGEWETLGTTPIQDVPVPRGPSRYRIELEGYETVEFLVPGGGTRRVPLQATDGPSPEGAWVEGFTATIDGAPVELDDYLIDRFEVTNRAFKAFVDAGGYERDEYWREAFIEDGRALTREDALSRFVDRTGRPGPATWEVGSYPDGQGDHPVGGVSWYEAAAYAAFAGKSLPTLHHWTHAFEPGQQAYVMPLSNLERSASAEVGAFRGVTWSGAFDMAGNVREWVLNQSGDDRYILGGGWNDAGWAAYGTFAQSPFDRSPTNGIRLARYASDEGLASAARPVAPTPIPDYDGFEPITDDVFEIYRRMFAYDATPLQDRIEAVDTTEHWTRERVTFDAAYGGERMILHLFLPRGSEPPFQTIVFWPGSNALTTRSINDLPTGFDFLVKSGRAVAVPAYRGTLERETGFAERAREQGLRFNSTPRATSFYREHVIQWIQDVGRTIDYLEHRPDADAERLGFFGASWGGRMASIALALEPRFDVAVLNVAGFAPTVPQPEVHAVTYAPRVTLPVLMLSGQYDHIFPLETQARPLFERLGTRAEDKRHVVAAGGHFVPRIDLMRESLAWFDQYLGPVR